MRIRCPFCGERDSIEFSYLGDAGCRRPDANAPDAQARFFEAVYLRNNPAGMHEELWYHAFGCGSWLRVIRDTRSHVIHAVSLVEGAETEGAGSVEEAAGTAGARSVEEASGS